MKPEIKTVRWGGHPLKVVRISSVPGFAKWLAGKTMPLLKRQKDPFDWAYYNDYLRFARV